MRSARRKIRRHIAVQSEPGMEFSLQQCTKMLLRAEGAVANEDVARLKLGMQLGDRRDVMSRLPADYHLAHHAGAKMNQRQ